MVKVGVKDNKGRPVVILGLSEKNLEFLKEGKPISFDLTPFGITGQALIMYGKTEEDITQELSKVFSSDSN